MDRWTHDAAAAAQRLGAEAQRLIEEHTRAAAELVRELIEEHGPDHIVQPFDPEWNERQRARIAARKR